MNCFWESRRYNNKQEMCADAVLVRVKNKCEKFTGVKVKNGRKAL